MPTIQTQSPTEAPEATEEETTQPDADTPTEEDPAEGEATDAVEESDEDAADDKDAELPDWAREKLTKANGEAARYRTALRDAEAKLKDAKTPADIAAVTEAMTGTIISLERELVATKYGLPDELAEVLKGSTREELEAHAKKLQRFVYAGEEPPLGGGLNPLDGPGPKGMTPQELAAQYSHHRARI